LTPWKCNSLIQNCCCRLLQVSQHQEWTVGHYQFTEHRSCLCWRCYHPYVWSARSSQCPPINVFAAILGLSYRCQLAQHQTPKRGCRWPAVENPHRGVYQLKEYRSSSTLAVIQQRCFSDLVCQPLNDDILRHRRLSLFDHVARLDPGVAYQHIMLCVWWWIPTKAERPAGEDDRPVALAMSGSTRFRRMPTLQGRSQRGA